MLERSRELELLGDVLNRTAAGQGQVVVIEAAAGIGKTSLLRAALQSAGDAGFTCLRARATELERDFAFGMVRQLLEPTVARATGAEEERLFAGAAALSRPLFGAGVSPGSAIDGSFSMLHGLYWLLNNLADEGPVALAVDDVQWSDAESLRFLNYLAPRIDGLALAVIATTRSGDAITPDMARLAASPETTVLRPVPLSREAARTLCQRRLGAEVADEFAAACHEATAGNPFLLEALLRDARDQALPTDAGAAARVRRIGPAAVAQAVLLRLAAAPPAATAVVRALAILGDGAGTAEAAGLAGLGEEEVARAADLLVALAILAPGERLEFAHPIVRESVYADIGARERAQAHARAAALLAAAGAREERIAAQAAATEPAGDPERVELLRRVAADALRRGAPNAAVAWLARALAEPPTEAARPGVLVELGSAEVRIGAAAAIEHLSEALSVVQGPVLLERSVRQLALALTMSGRPDRAVAAIEETIEAVEGSDRERALLLEAERQAHAEQISLEQRPLPTRRLDRHANLPGETPGERLVLATIAHEQARSSESATEAAAHLERALAGGRLLDDQALDIAGLYYHLLAALVPTDALDVVEACAEMGIEHARKRASIPATAFATGWRGWVALHRGAIANAEADARTAVDLLTSHGITLGRVTSLGLLIRAQIEAGELDDAAQTLRGSGYEQDIPATITGNFLLEARALLRIEQGRTREGVEDLREFSHRYMHTGACSPLGTRWRSHLALALAALGDQDEARELAATDLVRARRWGAATGIGMALRAVALVEGGDEAIPRLREAVEVLAQAPGQLEHARALVDLGAALRRGNQRADARGTLQDALALAERGGARALAERARTELRAAGGRSSDPLASGIDQLTASERRVAELAAEGRSNPEIAQALFVTRKTVETHLGHIYRKLDIAGRGQLAGALAASPAG